MRKQFIVVVIFEFTAIAILSMIAHVIHRPDLAPVLAAIVVGLHFLPLGKIFRQPRYYFWGIAIMLWCVFCAFSFRSNMLVAWSNVGTGVLLWACCAHGLLRARGIVRSLVRQPDVSPSDGCLGKFHQTATEKWDEQVTPEGRDCFP
jgi:hypothetical protein